MASPAQEPRSRSTSRSCASTSALAAFGLHLPTRGSMSGMKAISAITQIQNQVCH